VVDRDELDAYRGPQTEIVDFGNKTLLPGFVDPHAHTEVASIAQYGVVDVRVPKCANIPEVLDTIRAALGQANNGWIVAQANLFFDRKLDEGRFPTRAELDSVSRDIAIFIRAGGHLSILNSRALELSGISRDQGPADSGSITGTPNVAKDAAGEPTGIVMEMDNLIPFPRPDASVLGPVLEEGVFDMFTRFGVTTIGEISETLHGLEPFRSGIRDGKLHTRLHAYLWMPGTISLDQIGDPNLLPADDASDPDMFSLRGVKVWGDGGFSAARAAISTEYLHQPGSNGEVAVSRDELIDLYRRTRDAGLQLALHANGDRAQLEVCDAFTEARERYGDHPQIRIEHAGNYVPDYPKLSVAWRRAGIVPVPQPIFIKNFGEFVPDYVGEQAWQQQFFFRTMIEDGWEISGSSDVWIGSDYHQTNPFNSVASAVRRLTYHEKELVPSEAVSQWQALAMHNRGGAFALGLQGSVGELAPNAHADLVTVDQDPVTAPAEAIAEISVEDVVFNGQPVTLNR